jgi:hypothetical protein
LETVLEGLHRVVRVETGDPAAGGATGDDH